jgi:hypothetical protein
MTTKTKNTGDDKVHHHPYKDNIDTRVALLEKSIDTLNDTLVRIEYSFTNQLIRLENKMEEGFFQIREEFKDMRKEIKSDNNWLLSIIGASWLSLFSIITGLGAIMAHGFHWF